MTVFEDFAIILMLSEMQHLIKNWYLQMLQQEELSEQQVRIGLVEKKLETASRDADEKCDSIQRKLDDAQNLLRKKEK